MPRSKKSEKYPVMSLAFLNTSRKLWLSPSYQREAVWVLSQKQLLIDSLLQDFDVPKLYFRAINHDGFEFEVVDGQQRLRAIFEYIADGFKLKSDADDVGGLPVKSKAFSGLDTQLQMRLQQTNLDVVVLEGYNDGDVEDMFLRLQNGTTLAAAEKRRAIPGNMRAVVKELAEHKAFELSGFSPTHAGFEDAAAKALHLLLNGSITDIRPTSIEGTYSRNAQISMQNVEVQSYKRALAFLKRAFANKQNPKLKKYMFITFGFLLPEMMDTYDLSQRADEFAEAYLDFEAGRIRNEELPEGEQDSKLAAFTDAARSDSIPSMRYRHEYLRDYLISVIPVLVTKDPSRAFSPEQRMAIYRKDSGICQAPGCGVHCEESDFHADHIVPHSRGGVTSVANGRVLCPTCNMSLGNRQDY